MPPNEPQPLEKYDFSILVRQWEEVLVLAYQELKGGKVTPSKVIQTNRQGLEKLWQTYTQERRDLSKGLLSHKRQALAYYAGFHLTNTIRAAGTLQRSGLALRNWQGQPVQVVDLGCGTGASSIAVANHLASVIGTDKLSFQLFDNTGSVLDLARLGLQVFADDRKTVPPIRSARLGLENLDTSRVFGPEGITILCLGYVWNELGQNPKALRRLKELLQLCDDKPIVLLVTEPAAEGPARKAMQLRNELVEKDWQARYPCPAAHETCPMTADSRDWCYSEFRWQPPATLQLVDRILGIRRQTLGCAGYLFTKNLEFEPSHSPIVVGRPRRKQSDRFDYLVCHGHKLTKQPPAKPTEQLLRGEQLPSS